MSVPTMIGRYRLGPRLGAGGYAVVWLAHDESLDTMVAIKVMAENWIDQTDLRDRFLAEARMLRRAASSRVVQVFDIGELPDGRPYFVMEHADLGTLEDRVAQGRLPLVEALRVTAEIARGAAELHRLDIVHRDLKPSNVLIRSSPGGRERLLIADLGVAKNLTQGTSRTLSVGSAGYMAPEQSMPDSRIDARADVYSLGALGFDLITGRQPPTSGPVLPEGADPDLPEQVRQVLKRALEPDRDRRWPEAATLADRLDELADEFEFGIQPEIAPPSPQPGRAVIAPESHSGVQAPPKPRTGSAAHSGPRRRSGSGRRSGSRVKPRRERASLTGWVRNRRALLIGALLLVVLGGGQLWLLARSPTTLDEPARSSAVTDPIDAGSTPTAATPATELVADVDDGDHYGLLRASATGEITVDLVDFLSGDEALAKCREDFGPVPPSAVCGAFYFSVLEPGSLTLPVGKKAEISYVIDEGDDERRYRTLNGVDAARLSALSKTYQQGRIFQFTLLDGVISDAVQVALPCKDVDGIDSDGENKWTSKCVQRS